MWAYDHKNKIYSQLAKVKQEFTNYMEKKKQEFTKLSGERTRENNRNKKGPKVY